LEEVHWSLRSAESFGEHYFHELLAVDWDDGDRAAAESWVALRGGFGVDLAWAVWLVTRYFVLYFGVTLLFVLAAIREAPRVSVN
jgi:hypothetical protein